MQDQDNMSNREFSIKTAAIDLIDIIIIQNFFSIQIKLILFISIFRTLNHTTDYLSYAIWYEDIVFIFWWCDQIMKLGISGFEVLGGISFFFSKLICSESVSAFPTLLHAVPYIHKRYCYSLFVFFTESRH